MKTGEMMVKSALLDSWNFFKNNITGISIIILPIVIPVEIITSIYTSNQQETDVITAQDLYPALISMLFYPIYSIAVIVYISSIVNNKKYNLKQLYESGLRLWLPFIIMSVSIGFIFFGGLMLFILPGFYFLVRYSLSEFFLILEGEKPLDAMRKSWGISSTYFTTLLSGYLVIAVCIMSPVLMLNSFLEKGTEIYHIVNTIENILFPVLNTFYTVYAYRIYEYSKQIDTRRDDS